VGQSIVALMIESGPGRRNLMSDSARSSNDGDEMKGV
jgi:hypothetical protein